MRRGVMGVLTINLITRIIFSSIGYLLTRESIRLFVEEGLDKDKCQIKSDDFEDVNIGV
jgi:hypothetical protein